MDIILVIYSGTFAELLKVEIPEDAAKDSFSNLSLWKKEGKCDRISTIYSWRSGYLGVASGKWKLAFCEDGGYTPIGLSRCHTAYGWYTHADAFIKELSIG